MASRFVSGGTVDEPTERDEAWLKAQKEIEAKQIAKQEASKHDGGKSLYETLQANKAAKQEAFEESIRLKNQFRSLDDDEIDFLDSVLESTRQREREVNMQTAEQLELFRRQRDEAEKTEASEDQAPLLESQEAWAVASRKRKKGREKEGLGGVKIRRISSAEKAPSVLVPAFESAGSTPAMAATTLGHDRSVTPTSPPAAASAAGSTVPKQGQAGSQTKSPTPASSSLGLVGYSSGEDD